MDISKIGGLSPSLSDAIRKADRWNDTYVNRPIPTHIVPPRVELPNPAKSMRNRIVRSINDFEATLDDAHEVGLRLVGSGSGEVLSIDDVGYFGVDMIIFSVRTSDGSRAQLLQHVSQVNVLLTAAKASVGPTRIGFVLMKDCLEPEG